MITATLHWSKFDNFFRLREENARERKLIYVIGRDSHCYIGSIGSKGGRKGLGTRYQSQYLKLSRAIFGHAEEDGLPCYAAKIAGPGTISPELILAIEAEVQRMFVSNTALNGALFTQIRPRHDVVLAHQGDIPAFLLHA